MGDGAVKRAASVVLVCVVLANAACGSAPADDVVEVTPGLAPRATTVRAVTPGAPTTRTPGPTSTPTPTNPPTPTPTFTPTRPPTRTPTLTPTLTPTTRPTETPAPTPTITPSPLQATASPPPSTPSPPSRGEVPADPRPFPLIGLELPVPDGWAVAETSTGPTERRVDLTTETGPEGPVRFALIRSGSGDFHDPAVRAGSLIDALRANATELNFLELSRFAALERLLDGVLLRADYLDANGIARHTIIVAFPHPGAADASAVVISGPRSTLTEDAALAGEVDAMLRGIRFLSPGPGDAEEPREVQTDPRGLRLTLSGAWDGPAERAGDLIFYRATTTGALAKIRIRTYTEPGPIASSEVLRRYLNQIVTDSGYANLSLDEPVSDSESISGLRRAARVAIRYDRGGLPYASVIVALAYGDRVSYAVDFQIPAAPDSRQALADEIESIVGSIARF